MKASVSDIVGAFIIKNLRGIVKPSQQRQVHLEEKKKQEVKLEIQLDEDMAQGAYVNLASVNHNEAEFVVDFIFVQPQAPRAKVRSRVILSPQHAITSISPRSSFPASSAVGSVTEAISAPCSGDAPIGYPFARTNLAPPFATIAALIRSG